jgi:putative membrane protein
MARLRALLAAAAIAAAAPILPLSAQSAAGQTAAAAAAKVDAATEQYVREAARQDRAAIEASRLVLERSARTPVREAAKKVLDERTKAQHRLTTAASVQALGVRPDKSAAEAGEKSVEALRATAPEGLDRAYVRLAIETHEVALKLQQRYGDDGANDALRSNAMADAIQIDARLGDLRRLARELDGAS